MRSSRKPKVIIDTNIFVSGILFGGNAEQVLRRFQDGAIDVIVSPAIIIEILTTLKKFAVSEVVLDDLASILQEKARKVLPREAVRLVRDPDDAMLLEAAKAAGAEYLVTGDKDLLSLGSFASTLILTPKEFLDVLKREPAATE